MTPHENFDAITFSGYDRFVCNAASIQADGKIVLAGRARPTGETTYDFVVIRLDGEDGEPDTSSRRPSVIHGWS